MSVRKLCRLALTTSLASTALVLAACGGDDNDGLTVYSGRNEDLVGPLFERFEKESGVELNVRYADTAELASTLREEGDGSPADVFFGQDAGALGALEKEQLFAPLPPATLEGVPAQYRSTGGTWVGTSARARIIGFDTRKVQEDAVPDSVFDLVKPEYRGKVGWAPTNGSFQAFVTAMRKISGEDVAAKWLADMKANGTKAYDSNIVLRDAIAAGEVELGLLNHYYVLEAREADGADYPVGIHFVDGKDPGALVNVAGVGVLKSTDRAPDAQKLVDFLLAQESQQYFATETFEYPLAQGVPSPEGVPALDEIANPDLDLADLDDLAGTLALIEKAGVL